ncbi:trypsin-like isoform X2 [Cydia pomonella]|uniref:trypsin-like isoform X2 n=1 Tax=Cydia pomonella TaxID=82600 RepID=UPI002ADE12A3|nr:trypsin-like isoform X2 [Cydia pomonella]
MNFKQLLLIHSLAHAHGIMTESNEELLAYRLTTAMPKTLEASVAHHALVVYNRIYCSGSFIGSKVVLTVASCFQEETDTETIYVKYGVRNYMDRGQVIAVVENKKHEFFQYKSALDNDIALLILKTHVKFDVGERKSVLLEPGTTVPNLSFISVTGWGKEVAKDQENCILQSDMQLIDQEECVNTYSDVVTSSLFCAKYDLMNRLSDNGGAAMYKGMIMGISSYGANLEDAPHIALFTNVSYFYQWIKLNTERLLQKHCSQKVEDVVPNVIPDY